MRPRFPIDPTGHTLIFGVDGTLGDLLRQIADETGALRYVAHRDLFCLMGGPPVYPPIATVDNLQDLGGLFMEGVDRLCGQADRFGVRLVCAYTSLLNTPRSRLRGPGWDRFASQWWVIGQRYDDGVPVARCSYGPLAESGYPPEEPPQPRPSFYERLLLRKP